MPIRALQTHPAGNETDCATVGGHGVQIPGDTAHITHNYTFESDAQLILVIEKDAIFQVGPPDLIGASCI
jgi:DNA topoisomerase VI subunit A